jgi:hypothetical protein
MWETQDEEIKPIFVDSTVLPHSHTLERLPFPPPASRRVSQNPSLSLHTEASLIHLLTLNSGLHLAAPVPGPIFQRYPTVWRHQSGLDGAVSVLGKFGYALCPEKRDGAWKSDDSARLLCGNAAGNRVRSYMQKIATF